MRKLAALAFALLAGCSGSGGDAVRSYDLGSAAPKAKLPPLGAVTVRAAQPFDGVEMHYRLAYRNAAELGAFGFSRWAAPPAELLRRQVLRALPGAGPCTLEVEIHGFSQVFSAKEASEARIELHAVLGGSGGRLARRGFSVVEGNAGTDAAGGAAAMARGSERLLEEIAGWIAGQPGCRG